MLMHLLSWTHQLGIEYCENSQWLGLLARLGLQVSPTQISIKSDSDLNEELE